MSENFKEMINKYRMVPSRNIILLQSKCHKFYFKGKYIRQYSLFLLSLFPYDSFIYLFFFFEMIVAINNKLSG